MFSLDHFGLTDAGKVRQNNEDSLLSGGSRDPALFAVADGIGGFEAGEVASSIAVDSLQDLEPGDSLEEAVRDANRRVYSAARDDEKLSGMGTTVVAVRLTDTRDDGVEAEVVHVGDSRAYLLRDGELQPLTEDHSLVAELVRSGSLTRAQASEHPQKNLITRALGAEQEVEVDSSRHLLRRGDRIVLCSDGLPDMISEAKISDLISGREAGGAEESARDLISAALSAGGTDNVTVVVVDVKEVKEASRQEPQAPAAPATENVPADATSRLSRSEVLDAQIAEPATEGERSGDPEDELEPSSPSRVSRGRRLRRKRKDKRDTARRGGRRDSRESGTYANLREGESLIPGVWDGAVVETEEPPTRQPTPEEVVEQYRYRPEPDVRETREDPKRRRRRKRAARRRRAVSAVIRALATLAVVGLLLVPPYLWWSTRYYMSYNNNEVVIHQGVPYDFLGNELNRVDQRTGVKKSDIAEPYRGQIKKHQLYTADRLQTVLKDLQKQ